MQEADRKAIHDVIQKPKAAATAEERDRVSADLETIVMMACEPEMQWADQPPVILTQGARTYRAYPII